MEGDFQFLRNHDRPNPERSADAELARLLRCCLILSNRINV